MAKSIKFFHGTDTFGREVNVAQRLDGAWFARSESETQWGNQMGRWEEHKEPTFETHYNNEYSGERCEYLTPKMAWGFKTLEELDYKGSRLPNTNMGEVLL
jgi:hypothetical protein